MISDHLSDELLSAHLDGAAAGAGVDGAAVEDHLATCPSCAARRASLRAVSELVRTPPVPVLADARAAAVAAVLARTRLGDAPPPVHSVDDDHRAPVHQLAWYRRPSTLAGAAAAAAVVAALAIPLALGTHPSSNATSAQALGGVRQPKASAAPYHGAPSQAEAPAVPMPGSSPGVPDLGAVGSTTQLQSDVAGLAPSGSGSANAPSASTAAPSASAPALSPPPSTGVSSACVQATRQAADGGAYGPAVVATATYQGTAAVVMEFWPTLTAPSANAAPGARGVIAVVSQGGCTLLATTPT